MFEHLLFFSFFFNFFFKLCKTHAIKLSCMLIGFAYGMTKRKMGSPLISYLDILWPMKLLVTLWFSSHNIRYIQMQCTTNQMLPRTFTNTLYVAIVTYKEVIHINSGNMDHLLCNQICIGLWMTLWTQYQVIEML